MYKEYFGLKDLPFSIAPDPHYLYMSNQHREALAHLLYGINSNGGFILLTGAVGTGKTTICRCLLEQMPENTNIAFILNPKLTVTELLAAICDELGIHYPENNKSIKVFIDNINEYLLNEYANRRKTVIIIEEAQNLSFDVLEQVRLLTNLETNQQKLLQIIMIGQPELIEILFRPEMSPLAQRITARYHIEPLSKEEVAHYVAHRLSVAGVSKALFLPETINKLYALSNGIPRLINLICDRALLGAYAHGKERIDKSTIIRASQEVFGDYNVKKQPRRHFKKALVSLMIIIAAGAALAAIYYNQKNYLPLLLETEKPAQTNIEKQAHLDSLQDQKPIPNSKEMAYHALFKQWNLIYQPKNNNYCEQAKNQGLQCLTGIGSLDAILMLNRPAVLKMYDNTGQEFYAALIAVKTPVATLVLGDEEKNVHIKEIKQHWLGDYTILWKTPPDYKSAIRLGVKGSEVEWLASQLALIHGKTSSIKNKVFDNELAMQVKKFQLSEGLMPDGIAGPLTLIRLNTIVDSKEPLLIEKEGR